jgi:serine protease Do
MKYLLRPYITIALAILGCAVLPGRAQSTRVAQILEKVDPLLSHSSQGYLGVLVSDLDTESAAKLKLKEVRGALITLIDHDAPAGQAGLRINDVVLEINGQRVEGAEQFGRMLREIPAGRKIHLLLSRDGANQDMEVQLCDRKVMEQDVWNKLGHQADAGSSAPTKGIFSGGDVGTPGFRLPNIWGSSLNVGAMVEPLHAQTAEVLGVQNGIVVKQVARKSEADAAGLKPRDVILKVGSEPIKTIADWDRTLRSNQDHPVQVTILRDGKQLVLNLQVDSKHKKSQVDYQDFFPGLLPDGPCPLMAELDPAWAADAQAAAEQLRSDADKLQKEFNSADFKIDPQAIQQLQQQMDQFRKEFDSGAFQIDPKQMEEFKRHMDQFRKSMPQLFNQQQLDHLRRELQQLRSEFSQQV